MAAGRCRIPVFGFHEHLFKHDSASGTEMETMPRTTKAKRGRELLSSA
jgi:hypothetical protein